MSTTVDSHITTMKFDNSTFKSGITSTLGMLTKLKSNLSFGKENAQLEQLQNSGQRFNMGNMSATVEGISGKFLALGTVAVTALTRITNKALDTGSQLVKSLTTEPIMGGLREYETGLNSVQTILANTQDSGGNLKSVNATLDELNTYADKTIYNFGEMARNIGTFTAAGVNLETSAASIKGIANLAALSGSNSQQASTAMYQLSQAIAAGRVSLQDWNSVVNAGMGGAVFQKALARTAAQMGTIQDGAVEVNKETGKLTVNGQSFRESITAKPGEQSWLTSDVLTTTLKQFTGDMKDAELAAMGFNKEQIKSIQTQAMTAQEAATKVKTLSQLIDTAKEAAGSGWAQTWRYIFGDFEEARTAFTAASDVVNGFIGGNAEARNKVLAEWKEMNGRTVLLDAIGIAFKNIMRPIRAVKNAFRDVFPAMTGKTLFDLTVRFKEFAQGLRISKDTAEDIRRTFRGVFAIFSIVGQIISGVIGVIFDLIGVVGEGSGGFLDFTGNIGDFLYALDQTMKKGDGLKEFFNGISGALEIALRFIAAVGKAFIGLFDGVDAGEIGSAFDPVQERFASLGKLGELISGAWNKVTSIFEKLADVLSPVMTVIGDAFSGIGDAIAEAFSGGDYSKVIDALNVGLIGGILFLIKKFKDDGIGVDFGGGFLGGVTDTLDQLTGTLKAMETQIQARALLLIAAAVGILTASVVALSLIDSEKLAKALSAMAVGFTQLLGTMYALMKMSGPTGPIQLLAIATAMILVAQAVLVLSVAMKVLSTMSWEEIAKGLTTVTVLLGALSAAAYLIGLSSGGMLRAGIAMLPLATSLLILGAAMKLFATMSWQDIGKGMTVLAGSLTVITLALMAIPPTAPLMALGLLGVAGAMVVLGGALKIFATMSWEDIGKGMTVLAGALLILAIGLNAMSSAIPGAIALGIASVALNVFGGALLIFSKLSWGDVGKGMTILAASLTILALGLTAMLIALPGAIALMVASKALAVFTLVLTGLSLLSWGDIVKGLIAIAAVFALLGAAGIILGPISPIILALSLALLAMGAGMALAGVGALALATAFSIFTAAGAAGLVMIHELIQFIPEFFQKLGEGTVAFAQAIAAGGPAILEAFTAILIALLDALIKVIPKIGVAVGKWIQTMVRLIRENASDVAQAAFELLLAFLGAIEDNIGKVADKAASIIVKFVQGIGRNIGDVIDAGFKMFIKFLEGIENAIRENDEEMIDAGIGIADAIVDGIIEGLKKLADKVKKEAGNLAKNAVKGAAGALGIGAPSKEFRRLGVGSGLGLIGGLEDSEAGVVDASDALGKKALSTMSATFAALGSVLSTDINMDPTITPILDLTKLQQDASRIGGILGGTPIDADLSLRQASDAYDQRLLLQEALAKAESSGGDEITIEYSQTLNSPKYLSASEVYRGTKSQLSRLKEALEES